jgi:aspartate racemase
LSKLLGIIGGMGTQASACFYEILHDLQSVAVEQEYIDVLLYSMPSIPDRTAYITGQSADNPFDSMMHAAKTLENAGVECIAVPCASSHYFYDDLAKAVSIPILNLLDETARYVKTLGAKKVCLLATNGTVKSRVFHNAFEKYDIEVTTPSESVQADLMELIYDIKRGDEISSEVLDCIISKTCNDEFDAVILGCTELCVLGVGAAINILRVLAEASIAFCKSGK